MDLLDDEIERLLDIPSSELSDLDGDDGFDEELEILNQMMDDKADNNRPSEPEPSSSGMQDTLNVCRSFYYNNFIPIMFTEIVKIHVDFISLMLP